MLTNGANLIQFYTLIRSTVNPGFNCASMVTFMFESGFNMTQKHITQYYIYRTKD